MLAEDFLPIAEARKHCRIVGTQIDDLLVAYRGATIAKIEGMTGRNIVDKPATVVEGYPESRNASIISFQVGDPIIPDTGLTLRYRNRGDTAGFDSDGSMGINPNQIEANELGFRIILQEVPNIDLNVPYSVTLDVGMVAGKEPDDMKVAALFLIAELQEGSAMDTIDEGVIQTLLSRYVTPPQTAGAVRARRFRRLTS